ncbi:MAG: Ig-like domain-containing protein [Acidobacteria bacterium]|nr:Ig-like domain-containing protein [Acidobacteriota bacterium]
MVADRHPRWPIKRVEFFLDGEPYNYRRSAAWWDPARLAPGEQVLRVTGFEMRGPRFTEVCTILEVPFVRKAPSAP